jgi:transposase-like protein
MTTQRRKFTAEFKTQVVLDMIKNDKSPSLASREYGVKDSVLARWKHEFLERAPTVFAQPNGSDEKDRQIADLERALGRATLELDMAKKVSSFLSSTCRDGGR